MAEQEARVLGSGVFITVDGKEYKLSPIGMGALQEVQREAVKAWKRDCLQAYKEGLKLLDLDPESEMTLLRAKLDELTPKQIDDMPRKDAYNVSMFDLTESGKYGEALYDLLEKVHGERPDREAQAGALLMAALDGGDVTPEEVEKITGTAPKRTRIPYDTWWITASYEGALTFVFHSVKIEHEEVVLKDVASWPLPKIMEAAANVESLTAPAVGNT